MATEPSTEEEPLDRAQLLAEIERLRNAGEQLTAENEYLLEAQSTLEETRNHYADLYDFAPMAWLTLDRDGSVDSVNRQALELLGQDRRRLLGMPFKMLVVASDRRYFQDHLLACERGTDAISCEVALSAVVPIHVRLVSRQSTGRGTARYVTALIDLRERVEAAAEHRRLSLGVRDARAANDAKDQFIAVLSHELRTPLTPVLAAVTALIDGDELPDGLRPTFAMLLRNVSAEARLIDDLLDVTRIARNKMSVDRHPMDVHTLVRETIETVRSEIEAKSHTVLVELDAKSSWTSGDKGRLRQVFSNLLRNAVKFTPHGGRLEVRSWNRGPHVAVEVRDSGRGIDEAAMPRLFAPFEQIIDETSATLGGLGLGLAICRGLVTLHGGAVSAFSQGRDQGSRFIVDLDTIPTPADVTAHRRTLTPPPARRLRILLVEDHADTIEVMSALLGQAGHEVLTADSVKAAQRVDFGSIDLVISDIGLGDESGIDLIRFVRQTSEVKAIALSGYGTESDKSESTRAGFNAHVTKPVNFDDLLGVIARVSA